MKRVVWAIENILVWAAPAVTWVCRRSKPMASIVDYLVAAWDSSTSGATVFDMNRFLWYLKRLGHAWKNPSPYRAAKARPGWVF